MLVQDVIKTRVQTRDLVSSHQIAHAAREVQPLLTIEASAGVQRPISTKPSTVRIAREAYQADGIAVFFRGLGICSARAFIVNAVQWAVGDSPTPTVDMRGH